MEREQGLKDSVVRSGRLAARSGASQQQVAIPSLDVHAMADGKELHLVVKTCAESDEGMNLVFVAYADFCVLAGSAAGQQDSVCVILEESHVFFVRISMVMPTGSIGLDGVQRTTMQIAVNDRVAVRVWDSVAAVPIRKIRLTLDLPSYSNRHPLQVDESELVDTVRRCFADNVLNPKQYLLAVTGGTRLRLRVINVESPRMDLSVALSMSHHSRLGAGSVLRMLESTHLRRIADLAWGCGREREHFQLTWQTAIECVVQLNSPINLRKQARTLFNKGKRPGASAASISSFLPSTIGINGGDSSIAEEEVDVSESMQFRDSAEGMVVVSVLDSGNADEQLYPGDIIESVNGQSVVGKSVADVKELTRGPRGSLVTLGFVRGQLRSFVTLERKHTRLAVSERSTSNSLFQSAQRPARLFSTPSKYDSPQAHIEPEAAGQRFDHISHAFRNSYTAFERVPAVADHLRTNVDTEYLANDSVRLRNALAVEQKRNKELTQMIDSYRHRANLAEKLAMGLGSQVEVLQLLVQEMQQEMSQEGDVYLSKAFQEQRDSIERLEDMVETLLTLGEQESAVIHADLSRDNKNLKTILSQLKLAEICGIANTEHQSTPILTLDNSVCFTSSPVFQTPGFNDRTQRPARMRTNLHNAALNSPSLASLSSLSNSLHQHHIMHSPKQSKSSDSNDIMVPSKSFLAGLSEATSSLRTLSPELAPLADKMSPFARNKPSRTWEEALSQICDASQISSNSKSTKIDTKTSTTAQSSNNLSMNFSQWYTPEKCATSFQTNEAKGSTDGSDVVHQLASQGPSSNFLSSQNVRTRKFVPPTFDSRENREREKAPCAWAAEQAGIGDRNVAIIHKLLLKGKTLGQILRNHQLNSDQDVEPITDRHILDYIHFCVVFGLQHHGHKPRWTHQFAESRSFVDDPGMTSFKSDLTEDHSVVAECAHPRAEISSTAHGANSTTTADNLIPCASGQQSADSRPNGQSLLDMLGNGFSPPRHKI